VTDVSAEGVIRSPNIWDNPDVYEVENRGVDPDGVIEAAMREIRGWDSATVLDVGCGTGFHLPRFAAGGAAHVVGVEPHPPLAKLARRRVKGLPGVEVREGTAQALPLAASDWPAVRREARAPGSVRTP